MEFSPKSISEHIECLARLTGAPRMFVRQVKALFTTKGISLDSDAAPYLRALDEAFRREESIRANSQRARETISRLQDDFSRIGRAYVQQLQRLKRLRSTLRGQARPHRRGSRPVTIQGDHRSFITRQQRDDVPLVPGPEEAQ
jgi:hypothetical protein